MEGWIDGGRANEKRPIANTGNGAHKTVDNGARTNDGSAASKSN